MCVPKTGISGTPDRVLGLLEEAVEQVAELGGEGVRAAVEGGEGHQERLVAQVDRCLVLLEPLLDLVLQRDRARTGRPRPRRPRRPRTGRATGRTRRPRAAGGCGSRNSVTSGQFEQLRGASRSSATRVRRWAAQDVGRGCGGCQPDDRHVLQDGGRADGDDQVPVELGEPVAGGEQVGLAQRAVAAGGEVGAGRSRAGAVGSVRVARRRTGRRGRSGSCRGPGCARGRRRGGAAASARPCGGR